MTEVKEKADSIFNHFYIISVENTVEKRARKCAKECALLSVRLVMASNPHGNPLNSNGKSTFDFWHSVLKEIEKIKP